MVQRPWWSPWIWVTISERDTNKNFNCLCSYLVLLTTKDISLINTSNSVGIKTYKSRIHEHRE